MTTPVRVVCDAMRADAQKWREAAAGLQFAAGEAKGLVLGPDKLGVAAQEMGVIAAYDELKEKITRLLTGGTTEFKSLATTLKQAADTYEREDNEGAHQIAEAGSDK